MLSCKKMRITWKLGQHMHWVTDTIINYLITLHRHLKIYSESKRTMLNT